MRSGQSLYRTLATKAARTALIRWRDSRAGEQARQVGLSYNRVLQAAGASGCGDGEDGPEVNVPGLVGAGHGILAVRDSIRVPVLKMKRASERAAGAGGEITRLGFVEIAGDVEVDRPTFALDLQVGLRAVPDVDLEAASAALDRVLRRHGERCSGWACGRHCWNGWRRRW